MQVNRISHNVLPPNGTVEICEVLIQTKAGTFESIINKYEDTYYYFCDRIKKDEHGYDIDTLLISHKLGEPGCSSLTKKTISFNESSVKFAWYSKPVVSFWLQFKGITDINN